MMEATLNDPQWSRMFMVRCWKQHMPTSWFDFFKFTYVIL